MTAKKKENMYKNNSMNCKKYYTIKDRGGAHPLQRKIT